MSVQKTLAKMEESVQIWTLTTPANALENSWAGTVSTVSTASKIY